jgi:STE24 endopeptidase
MTFGRRTALLAAAGIALWAAAAVWLWRSSLVPGGLRAPPVNEGSLFGAAELDEARAYESGAAWIAVGAIAAQLGALALTAWRAPAVARGIGIGPIGAGAIVGLLTMSIAWAVSIPFTVLDTWWGRRHGLVHEGYAAAVAAPWAELAGLTVTALVLVVVTMWLARRIGRLWWLAGVPVFAAVAALFAFTLPYLLTIGSDPVRDPELAAAVPRLERATGAGSTPVYVDKVSDVTTVPNAYTSGIGPSERVVLWDTLLDGRFTEREVEVVLAHELGHAAREHVWKGLAWFALLALPLLLAVAEVTRLRGGVARPENVALAALVLTCAGLCLAPVQNAVSRHFEQEADWIALEATRDPAAFQSLFVAFTVDALSDPSPPSWRQALFGSHPGGLQRIAMGHAWERRAR